MAEMAIGYGSEYQLLRYLGHHRRFLFQNIKDVIHTQEEIEWIDYPVDEKRLSMDGELKGVECFKLLPCYKSICEAWKMFWPQRGNSHNWDGIFKVGNTWYFVEAKAHLDEAFQNCGAKNTDSRKKIINAFEMTCGNKDLAKKWIESNSYQLANRMAFLYFCKENGIDAKLCYISFLNGFKKTPRLNVENASDWEKIWNEEYHNLQLTEEQKKNIFHVYIDCSKG